VLEWSGWRTPEEVYIPEQLRLDLAPQLARPGVDVVGAWRIEVHDTGFLQTVCGSRADTRRLEYLRDSSRNRLLRRVGVMQILPAEFPVLIVGEHGSWPFELDMTITPIPELGH
jgi:hypothetical protein